MKTSSVLAGLALNWALLLGACATTAPTRFYVLASPPDTQRVRAGAPCVVLGIGPVEIPAYLDRPQVVVRMSPNEIQPSDFDQWGEPLAQGIARVLADAISGEICVQRVEYFPWKSFMSVDYQVSLRVRRFEGRPGEKAELVAHWSLYGADPRKLLREGSLELAEPVPPGGYQQMVAVQSRLLHKAAGQIGHEILKLAR